MKQLSNKKHNDKEQEFNNIGQENIRRVLDMETVVVEVVQCITETEVLDCLDRMEAYGDVSRGMKTVGPHCSEKH